MWKRRDTRWSFLGKIAMFHQLCSKVAHSWWNPCPTHPFLFAVANVALKDISSRTTSCKVWPYSVGSMIMRRVERKDFISTLQTVTEQSGKLPGCHHVLRIDQGSFPKKVAMLLTWEMWIGWNSIILIQNTIFTCLFPCEPKQAEQTVNLFWQYFTACDYYQETLAQLWVCVGWE